MRGRRSRYSSQLRLGERPGTRHHRRHRARHHCHRACLAVEPSGTGSCDEQRCRLGRVGLSLALLSGVVIGLFFVALARTSDRGRPVAARRRAGRVGQPVSPRWPCSPRSHFGFRMGTLGTVVAGGSPRHARQPALHDCDALRTSERRRHTGVALSGQHRAAGASRASRATEPRVSGSASSAP